MKRILFLFIFCVMATSFVQAQSDCILCGTWKGEYSNRPPSGNVYSFQQLVKIRKVGDNYRVRLRRVSLDDGNVLDFGVCRVTHSDDYRIVFLEQGFQNNQYDSKRGLYYNVFTSYSLEYDLNVGVLYLYQNEGYATYYNKEGQFMYNDDYINWGHTLIVTLYGEDDDW